MKPRFSLLALLSITAYIAVAIAAILFPESPWYYVFILAWLLVIARLLVAACGPPSRSSYPARVVLAGTLTYFLVAAASGGQNSSLPHAWIVQSLLGHPVPSVIHNNLLTYPNGQVRSYFRVGTEESRIDQFALCHTALLFGAIAACMARRTPRTDASRP